MNLFQGFGVKNHQAEISELKMATCTKYIKVINNNIGYEAMF